ETLQLQPDVIDDPSVFFIIDGEVDPPNPIRDGVIVKLDVGLPIPRFRSLELEFMQLLSA
ncbi:hypothetical protein, partial [Streptomyces qinglanensis]|uniref:hypothetical protein n=1 Tax=Streptomyces qinglanensis TaxID=943816 RepID=UPI003D75BA1D